jgi:hypothetical protein
MTQSPFAELGLRKCHFGLLSLEAIFGVSFYVCPTVRSQTLPFGQHRWRLYRASHGHEPLPDSGRERIWMRQNAAHFDRLMDRHSHPESRMPMEKRSR